MDTQYLLSRYFYFIVYAIILLFLYSLHKISFFKDFIRSVKNNKKGIFVLLSIGLLLALNTNRFEPIVYFDEQNYLIEGKNIIEVGLNAICFEMIEGECSHYSLAPHGIAVSSIYALLYSSDFAHFDLKVRIFSLILYLINACLVYLIAHRFCKDKIISRWSALISIFLPFNIVFSTNVMPAMLSAFFFNFALYSFVSYNQVENSRTRGYLFLGIISLVLLSLCRVEYIALLGLGIAMYLAYIIKRKKIRNYSGLSVLLSLPVISSVLFYLYYRNAKIGSSLGLDYLNSSYFGLFIDSYGMYILSAGLLLQIIMMVHKNQIKFADIVLYVTTIGYVTLYSMYNFIGEYRYLIPISGVLIIYSVKGIKDYIEHHTEKSSYILSAILLTMCIFFVADLPEKYAELDERSEENANYIKLISELGKRENSDVGYLLEFPYLSQLYNIPNYSNRVEQMRTQYLYFVDNPTNDIDYFIFHNSGFEAEFSEELYGYKIWKLNRVGSIESSGN